MRAITVASQKTVVWLRFVVDNTIDSKERRALLDRARGASSEAMKRILSLMRSCVKDMEDSDQSKAGMEASMHQLDEDNTGLRHVIQRMLVTEGELRQQVERRPIEGYFV